MRRDKKQIFAWRAAVIVLCAVFFCAFSQTQDRPRESAFDTISMPRVLFISSYSYAWETVPLQIEGIRSELQNYADLDYVFMDTKSVNNVENTQIFTDHITNLINHSEPYDLLIVGDDAALEFAKRYKDSTFAGIPIVFEGVNNFNQLESLRQSPRFTGVMERIPYKENIDFARMLYPNTKRVVAIVDDTVSGVALQSQYSEVAKLYPQLTFATINSSHYSYDGLCKQLSALGPNDIVFYVLMNSDSSGTNYPISLRYDTVLSRVQGPVFLLVQNGMGKGFLGGNMVSHKEMGALAGKMARQILEGADITAMPIIVNSPSYFYLDEDVLKKYDIPMSKVPADAILLNHETSYFEKNPTLMVVMMAALILLVVVAVFDNLRRRRLYRELRIATEANERTAHTDTLTGIYNRSYFSEQTEELLRSHPNEIYVIIRTDIERFKVINDLFGTKAGDTILRRLALVLCGIVKKTGGTVARYQADNFVICMPLMALDMPSLMETVKRGLRTVEHGDGIVMNYGVYEIEDINMPVQLMSDRAHLALTSIKGKFHKNYAVYDESLRNELLEEEYIIGNMREGLEKREFCIYLQPIYSITTHQPVSAEALVRWNHPQKGFIPPDTFIPVFEKNGFVTQLDAFVREEVCRVLREELDAGHPIVPVSVNVSRANFYNPQLCEEMQALVVQYGLDPKLLKLEITETAYTENPYQLLDMMKKLQKAGFLVLMDDFGSGYSSLNMLKDVPVDLLKLDMRFLGDLNSLRTTSILGSVVAMAKQLHMTVVAEGVETEEQLEFLHGIGCDHVQGYYFSRPLTVEDFCSLIRSTAPQ